MDLRKILIGMNKMLKKTQPHTWENTKDLHGSALGLYSQVAMRRKFY